MAKKAITCEESNIGKHWSPNIITGVGNFPRYFVLKPSLGLPASMGSSELQWVLHQPHACLLQLGFADQCSRLPFSNFSPYLSPHHLAVHHQSHGSSSFPPLLYVPPCPFTLMLYQSYHSQKWSCMLGFLPFRQEAKKGKKSLAGVKKKGKKKFWQFPS